MASSNIVMAFRVVVCIIMAADERVGLGQSSRFFCLRFSQRRPAPFNPLFDCGHNCIGHNYIGHNYIPSFSTGSVRVGAAPAPGTYNVNLPKGKGTALEPSRFPPMPIEVARKGGCVGSPCPRPWAEQPPGHCLVVDILCLLNLRSSAASFSKLDRFGKVKVASGGDYNPYYEDCFD